MTTSFLPRLLDVQSPSNAQVGPTCWHSSRLLSLSVILGGRKAGNASDFETQDIKRLIARSQTSTFQSPGKSSLGGDGLSALSDLTGDFRRRLLCVTETFNTYPILTNSLK